MPTFHARVRRVRASSVVGIFRKALPPPCPQALLLALLPPTRLRAQALHPVMTAMGMVLPPRLLRSPREVTLLQLILGARRPLARPLLSLKRLHQMPQRTLLLQLLVAAVVMCRVMLLRRTPPLLSNSVC